MLENEKIVGLYMFDIYVFNLVLVVNMIMEWAVVTRSSVLCSWGVHSADQRIRLHLALRHVLTEFGYFPIKVSLYIYLPKSLPRTNIDNRYAISTSVCTDYCILCGCLSVFSEGAPEDSE